MTYLDRQTAEECVRLVEEAFGRQIGDAWFTREAWVSEDVVPLVYK